ncbi:Capsular polysaccharide synthesis protein [Pseudobutyrivibrio sp. JW11]|uniref:glycosyltransferase family 32 protein n=1 Tax=Pseudobutyrivibrio sp. JW11 TaxID=1855302 RepID=UPI0008ED55B6|nr:glycosyltransferase [Pseudobutyrivibrio sp. JW11]SFO35199.1 Capsular polysaccharide synthesis protein [Pseudobutyrivibrio sp. JW11]
MIPKIIHYCWFGRNEKSGLVKSCIESWKKYLPDYEIIEWNEDNFDVNICQYTKEAYEAGKWAFVSDYARLYALQQMGGVYFDTDIEALKPIDEFLDNKAFTGFEVKDCIVTAVLGFEKNHPLLGELIDTYNHMSFINEDGSLNMTTNVTLISNKLKEMGMISNGKEQLVGDLKIYPQIYFCPNNFSRLWNKPSKKSYVIHHFDCSWRASSTNNSSLKGRIRRYIVGSMRNTFGSENFASFRDLIKGKDK